MEELLVKEGLNDLPSVIKKSLIYISKYSIRFKDWFEWNSLKIRAKYNGAVTIEDKNDVTAELFCIAEILKSDFMEDAIYEPFGTERRAPDFKAIISSQILYIEVRRIRKSVIEYQRDEFLNIFASKVKEIRKNYGISIECNNLQIQGINENEKYSALILNIDNIKQYIDEKLNGLSETHEEWHNVDISLEEFADNFSINVAKVPIEKQDGKVHFYGGLYDIPYTGGEFRKFGDIIFDKIHQLVHGNMNIFFILADNDCHEFEDLLDSIHSINELIVDDDDEYFCGKDFNGKEDFLNQSRKLSGIIFNNKTNENKLWINNNAITALSNEIKEFVQSLNCNNI